MKTTRSFLFGSLCALGRPLGRNPTLWLAALLLLPPALTGQLASPAGGFAAGGRELFSTDFNKEPIGQFPKTLRQLRGSMEIVENAGKRMLRATDNAEFLVSLPERLPEHFTLEFDLVAREDYSTDEIAFEGTPAYTVGPASALVKWGRTGITIVGGNDAGNVYLTTPADLAAELPGQPAEFRADINGDTITFHANGRQIARVPGLKFVRSRVLRIFLGGEGSKLGASVHLSRLRIADAGTSAPTVAPERKETRMDPAPSGNIASVPSPTAAPTPVSAITGRKLDSIETRMAATPVTNLTVRGEHPGRHHLAWSLPANSGVKSFEIYRRDSSGWRILENATVAPGPASETYAFVDRSLVAPNSAYLVASLYTDGRRGEATVEYPSPPQAHTPAIREIVQTAQYRFRINWTTSGWEKFRIFWPGQTDTNLQPTPNGIPLDQPGYNFRFQTYPDGVAELVFPNASTAAPYEYQFAADYSSDGVVVVGPRSAPATITLRGYRATYRVVFTGLKLTEAVGDDILDFDGKGNEIFASAMIIASKNPREPVTHLGTAQTRVYGDNNNFPDRIRAGSAGATGGLRAGDFVPGMDILGPQPGLVGFNDRFPLKVWEGELGEPNPNIAIVPLVIEWNATDHSALNGWLSHWRGPVPSLQLAEAMDKALYAMFDQPLTAQPLFGMWSVEDYSKLRGDPTLESRPNIPLFDPKPGRDRIIGLTFQAPPKAFEARVYGHETKGLVLSYSGIERSMPAASSIYQVQCNWGDVIGGGVNCYFQIERLSPPLVFAPEHHTPAPPAPQPSRTLSAPPRQ